MFPSKGWNTSPNGTFRKVTPRISKTEYCEEAVREKALLGSEFMGRHLPSLEFYPPGCLEEPKVHLPAWC